MVQDGPQGAETHGLLLDRSLWEPIYEGEFKISGDGMSKQ